MFFGKILGGLFGLVAGGVFGLILGLLVGHFFDRGLQRAISFASPENIQRIKDNFFETTFLLCGYMAKVDGQISQREIEHTEQLFVQLGLSADQRTRAIDLFRRGSAADFSVEPVVAAFVATCGPQRQLQHTLLLFLLSLANADDSVAPAEHAALVHIAGLMGIGASQLEALLRMARAQEHFHAGGGRAAPSGNELAEAYAALGVEPDIDDRALKRAYRKRMSENHPDKLIAKGVPEEMVKLATERSQEIQSAYELIRKNRGGAR